MNRIGIAAAVSALALLTYFHFPGHTWLQQDSQIYAPILEHQRDPGVLNNDILVQHPHVAYTLYDEIATGVARITGLGFREILAVQQIAARALGIWGVWLLAGALGLGAWPSLMVAAIASLGALIVGPSVLTLEWEPTPRAIAVPLLFLATGLTAQRRYLGAAMAAGAAFLYHPLTAVPFWAVLAAVAIAKGRYRALAPLAVAIVILLPAARLQAGEGTVWFGQLTAAEEQIQRFRADYVWISMWKAGAVRHHLLVFAILAAAFARSGRKWPIELRWPVLGLSLMGLLSMPISYVLLERWHWALVPQAQPLRLLLFGTFAMVVAASATGALAAARGRWWEAALWFVPAYAIPALPTLTGPYTWKAAGVVFGLALATSLARRFAPAAALAAFLAMPLLGGVVNLHTPELAQLSGWARASTPRDSVFLFADAYRGLAPGIFRAEALRAIYVDWKGGGQVNYLKGFAEIWYPRWLQALPRRFNRAALAKLPAAGIDYIVLQPRNRLPQPAVYENAGFVVYLKDKGRRP